MKRLNACALAIGLAAFASSAWADAWNKKTILTVNETIVVPGGDNGVTLPPGKYVMKLMDSPSNRHIVQVFNEEENRILTTVLAIPNYRLQPTGDTKFTFWEVPADQPKALRSWFYPGDNFGQEFVYSRPKAIEIAKFSHQRVPMTESTAESEMASTKVETIDQAGTRHELDKETYTQPQAEPPREIAQAQPPAPAPEAAPTPAPEAAPAPVAAPEAVYAPAPAPMQELPSTSSSYPLYGLLGMLSIGAAGLARFASKR